MGKVAVLRMRDKVRVDTDRVRDIVNELGEVAAGGVIQMALEQMAIAVQSLQEGAQKGDAAAIIDGARRLYRLATQVGLQSLAEVAEAVADCAIRSDGVGLSATVARLLRVANISLVEIWEGVDEA
ncbi:hypothetical protein [Paracoccus aerodenitrificans]|uniref:hypothetical protein n=1 Tax=Paracoccus aerodenitrificans TaxID=3017781 RepID=UPI0022F12F96|nr:hypothetical protein [Paracoccus aerodenitrificans]WBU63303.1 hypothetical protein PAE61_13170 [Paracoccus aerodenitrificans]